MGPVLLLDVRPVVLVAGPGPGKGDLVLGAVVEEVGVDEFRSVIRIDSENRERVLANDVLECLEYPDPRLVLDRPVDRPTGRNVSNGKGKAELAG